MDGWMERYTQAHTHTYIAKNVLQQKTEHTKATAHKIYSDTHNRLQRYKGQRERWPGYTDKFCKGSLYKATLLLSSLTSTVNLTLKATIRMIKWVWNYLSDICTEHSTKELLSNRRECPPSTAWSGPITKPLPSRMSLVARTLLSHTPSPNFPWLPRAYSSPTLTAQSPRTYSEWERIQNIRTLVVTPNSSL